MSKRNYNQIEVKDNMKVEVDNNEEVVAPKEKEKINRLVSAAPKKVKRNLVSRLVTGVLGPEGLPGIGAYVNDEIVKPAIKNIIFDAITSAASMAMFGEKGGPSRGRGYGYGQHSSRRADSYKPATNYNSRYGASQPEQPKERVASRAYKTHVVEEYVIEDRFDAAHILTSLTEYADMYDTVSVADYYETIGVASVHTDNNYGWTIDSISKASIVPVRGGYIIKFPPVEVI